MARSRKCGKTPVEAEVEGTTQKNEEGKQHNLKGEGGVGEGKAVAPTCIPGTKGRNMVLPLRLPPNLARSGPCLT